tara:strand:+ start:610 stop:828 length:219 start_codon:yes stop_codon:yes gene_type:complete
LTTFDVESILIEYFEVADEDNDQVLNTFEFEKMKSYMYSKEIGGKNHKVTCYFKIILILTLKKTLLATYISR